MESRATQNKKKKSVYGCVRVFTCITAAAQKVIIAGEISAPWKASTEGSVLSRFRLNQKESQKQRDSGAMVGTITILFLCLSLFRATTHGGIAAQSGSATYSTMSPNNATQQQSAAITAPQEPVPRHIHVLFKVKKQQTFTDPHAEI